jgi:mannan endo-1,4-beta-mannosidase
MSQKAYKEFIKTLVTRYKNSTAIFAWKLANEPRCRTCPTSTIYNWATETFEHIKSLDSNHIITLGDEGWLSPADGYGDGSYAYSAYEGVDFVLNLQIKTLDYGTLHLYPNSWGYNYTWGNKVCFYFIRS